MVSHLVGGEAHVARRVRVQVLLLPPGSGCVGATGLPYRAVTPGLVSSIEGSNPSTPTNRRARTKSVRR